MSLPADGPPEEVIARGDTYEIARRRAGDFMIIRLSGRYADGLLDDLRSKVFLFKTNYAVDASGLAGITAAFTRELLDTAEALRSGERRLALLRPPEALRSILSMRGGKPAIEIFVSEEQLRSPGAALEPAGVHTLRELERLRKEFESDPVWRLADREGCWLCPYCGRVQEDVRLPAALAVSDAVLEKAYRHLWSKCPDFRPTSRRRRPPAELQEALRRANQDKVIVPRQKMDRMESQLAQLKGKAEELEENVRKASERQRRLLPAEAPPVPGAEIDLIYRPAEEVSGDFYDFVPLDDGKIAFLVGDVSGHGIAAGVVMGMAKKVLSLRLQDYQDPVEALSRTNADVDKDLGRMSFVTAFVAIYDPATRNLSCARAGHNPPLLYNLSRPGRCLEVNPAGMGLGIMDPSSFEPTMERLDLRVEPEDVLLLYTDGLVEARDEEGEQFGVPRVTEVLASTFGYPPSFILSTLAGTLDRFTRGRASDDDLTAVCVRFR